MGVIVLSSEDKKFELKRPLPLEVGFASENKAVQEGILEGPSTGPF